MEVPPGINFCGCFLDFASERLEVVVVPVFVCSPNCFCSFTVDTFAFDDGIGIFKSRIFSPPKIYACRLIFNFDVLYQIVQMCPEIHTNSPVVKWQVIAYIKEEIATWKRGKWGSEVWIGPSRKSRIMAEVRKVDINEAEIGSFSS